MGKRSELSPAPIDNKESKLEIIEIGKKENYSAPFVDNRNIEEVFDLNAISGFISKAMAPRTQLLSSPKHDRIKMILNECSNLNADTNFKHISDKLESEKVAHHLIARCLTKVVYQVSFDDYVEIKNIIKPKLSITPYYEIEQYREATKYYDLLDSNISVYAGMTTLEQSIEIINNAFGISLSLDHSVKMAMTETGHDKLKIDLSYDERAINIFKDIAAQFSLDVNVSANSIVITVND